MRRVAVAVALAAIAGCGDTVNNTYVGSDAGTGGDAAGTCTPNAKECVTSRVARICAADGTGWVSQQCDFGNVCTGGDCMPDPNVACTPGVDGACADATHALVCNSNGMGFQTVTCPSGTTCAGPGLCQGSCVVGSSFCLDVNTVVTCMDGKIYSPTSCSRGSTACVTTGTTPINTAACKPAECVPDPNGCDQVCGNKTVSVSNTDPGFVSFCQETSAGYKWAAIQCPSSQTCTPGVIACTGNAALSQASCASECTPGEVRCSADGQGTQACGNDGKWGTVTACTANATGDAQACIQPVSGNAVCGDPVCASSPGACEADGFHPCVNGKVSATAMACPTGTCVQNGSMVGKYQPGQCEALCATGDQRCVDATHIQSCTNGLWSSTLTACTGTDTCQSYLDPASGNPRAICGDCAPGTHQCTDNMGNPPAGATSTDIETCDATGHFGMHMACTVGVCQFNPATLDDACMAECIPSSTVCLGAAKNATGTPFAGTTSTGTCTLMGTFPASPTTCPGNTACRKGPGGSPVVSTNTPAACVECVGPNIAGGNEVGLVDTKCLSNGPVTCKTDNTFPTTSTACMAGNCVPESGSLAPPTCGSCGPFDPCTQSNIPAFFGGCEGGLIGPKSPAIQCGSTPDCCAFACNTPPPPTPATCQ